MAKSVDRKEKAGEQDVFDVPCICLQVRRAARNITRIFDRCLRPVGLKASQYGLLRMLSETREACISDIGRLMRMDQSTVTRNMDALAREGLASFSSHPDDPRKKVAHLTQKGAEKLEKARETWQSAQDTVKEQMGEQDFVALGNLLNLAAMLRH